MSSSGESRPGTFSTLSIGIGGMVGGGIFAVTGYDPPGLTPPSAIATTPA
jgi:hypothetical protein